MKTIGPPVCLIKINDAFLPIEIGTKINVSRYKISIPNSIMLVDPAIDGIKCPHCTSNFNIVHEIENDKPISNKILCPKCNKNIFSQIIISSNLINKEIKYRKKIEEYRNG
jgi:hypothetical protein